MNSPIFEEVIATLEDMSLRDAITLVLCLSRLGRIDHIVNQLVQYLYDRAARERREMRLTAGRQAASTSDQGITSSPVAVCAM